LPSARVETRYDLDDEGWSGWSTHHSETRKGLSPGAHVFKVQARSLFGTVSPPATLGFQVASPWRQPWLLASIMGWLIILAGLLVLFIRRRRLQESQRRHLEYRLRQSQKMEAIGVMAAGLSHDFNNLVTTLLGYTDRARAVVSADSNLGELIEGIHDVAQEASGVTRSLMTFCRQSSIARQAVDLGAVVGESVPLLRRMLPAKVVVEYCPAAPGPVQVMADPSQLRQALLNLALNARDAMPDGGTLRMTLARRPAAAVADAVAAAVNGAAVAVLTVEDNGTGMSDAVRERAFEPFFSTKTRERGTGLGLAVVHGIVTGHGGAVRLDSAEGRGTCVTVLLPCCGE
jgi:signal transduction histidine kinase